MKRTGSERRAKRVAHQTSCRSNSADFSTDSPKTRRVSRIGNAEPASSETTFTLPGNGDCDNNPLAMTPLENYLRELTAIRNSGGGVKETSYYTPLANLLIDLCVNNAIMGVQEAEHLCPGRRGAPTSWKTGASEP